MEEFVSSPNNQPAIQAGHPRISQNRSQKKHFYFLITLFFLIIGMTIVILAYTGNKRTQLRSDAVRSIPTPTTPQAQTQVAVKEEYTNPFDKKTQYVNPFSSSKNPFDNLQ